MDKISKERRSENMRRIKSKNTKPELLVRRLVYSLGYRYRLHRKDIPGKPDLVFIGKKKAIFVHGCYWHQHGDSKCKISRKPKSNIDYWKPKLERNVKRDIENQKKLKEIDWGFLIVWECELKGIDSLTSKIKRFLK